MGLTKFLLKKVAESPEEKAKRLEHKKAVAKAYQAAYDEEELTQATARGKAEAAKGKKKGGLLNTIGNVAQGALYGMEKGAKAFNDGIGSNEWSVPKQSDALVIPDGNSDIFFGSQPPKRKKKYERDW
jgi:hypothetical protein